MGIETASINVMKRIMMAVTFAKPGDDSAARDILSMRTDSELRPVSRARKESGKRPELQV